MSVLQPGDLVRCIAIDSRYDQSVEVGKTYTCTAIMTGDDIAVELMTCTLHGESCRSSGAIQLKEVPLPEDCWWCGACFAPIQRRYDWQKIAANAGLAVDPPHVKKLYENPPRQRERA